MSFSERGAGRGRGRGGRRREQSKEVQLSKALTWLCRHAAIKEGLKIRADGYVALEALMAHHRVKKVGLGAEAVLGVVENDKKGRFRLVCEEDLLGEESGGGGAFERVSGGARRLLEDGTVRGVYLRANQGHSMEEVDAVVVAEVAPKELPTVIYHATFPAAWPLILESGGLDKMGRTHVHMVDSKESAVARAAAPLLVEIDVAKCSAHGVKILRSDNGVLLSRETVPTAAFRRCIRKKDNAVIWTNTDCEGTGEEGGEGGGGGGGGVVGE